MMKKCYQCIILICSIVVIIGLQKKSSDYILDEQVPLVASDEGYHVEDKVTDINIHSFEESDITKTYVCASDMSMDSSLCIGDIVETESFYVNVTGGGAIYVIQKEKGIGAVKLTNGLYACFVNDIVEDGYVDIRAYGVVGDGQNDYSDTILRAIDDGWKQIFFNDGIYCMKRNVVQQLEQRVEVLGNGKIDITDFYFYTNAKYLGNGEIEVQDFYNPYIASLNLPNQMKPYCDYGHQNRNGWITDYSILNQEINPYRLTPWFQIYLIDGCNTEANGSVTFCIGKAKFRYYDEEKNEWIVTQSGILPVLYGFYDRMYRDNSHNHGIMTGSKDPSIKYTDCGDYWEVICPARYFEDSVLHFGYDVWDVPLDREIYLISDIKVWVDDSKYENCFVANAGIDLKYPDSAEKQTREYIGGRYIVLSTNPSLVCCAYVKEHTEWLKDAVDYEQIVQKAGNNVLIVDNVNQTVKNGLTYSIEDGVLSITGTATADTDIVLGTKVLSDGTYSICYEILSGSISDNRVYYAYTSEKFIEIELKYFQRSYSLSGCTRNKLRIKKGQVFNNVRMHIWAWEGKSIGDYD